MLLSVCILMKGDAQSLRRLAWMIQTLADEIVVVCDEPVGEAFQKAADQCGARLVPHRWQNDFSAARNAGLQAANGEWVFWIDSDETLLAPDARAIRQMLERPEMLAYYVTIEDQAGTAIRTPRQHPSLYRRRPELRYHGRIHEHFEPTLETHAQKLGLKVSASPVLLTHTGYQPEKRPQKLQRNIAILELELADRPGQLYYLIELGRSLLLSGHERGHAVLAEAAPILFPMMAQGHPPAPPVAAFLEYALSHAPAGFSISHKMAADSAIRWFPSSPPLMWLAARHCYERGEIAETARLLRHVLDMGEKTTYDTTISFDQRLFGDETRLNYGVCCARLGEVDKAIEQFKLIASGSAFHVAAQENIKRLASG